MVKVKQLRKEEGCPYVQRGAYIKKTEETCVGDVKV
jgi:hypothetical protein